MTSLLTEGTAEYTSLQLAEKTERLGASISASSSDDFTVLAASSLSLYSSDILHLMAEVALRPVFPETELDLYRRNTIENLKFQRSQPGFLAGEQVEDLAKGSGCRKADTRDVDRIPCQAVYPEQRNVHRGRRRQA